MPGLEPKRSRLRVLFDSMEGDVSHLASSS